MQQLLLQPRLPPKQVRNLAISVKWKAPFFVTDFDSKLIDEQKAGSNSALSAQTTPNWAATQAPVAFHLVLSYISMIVI